MAKTLDEAHSQMTSLNNNGSYSTVGGLIVCSTRQTQWMNAMPPAAESYIQKYQVLIAVLHVSYSQRICATKCGISVSYIHYCYVKQLVFVACF